MSIIAKAEGKILSINIQVKMTPPTLENTGSGDALSEVFEDVVSRIENILKDSFCEEGLRIQILPTYIIY